MTVTTSYDYSAIKRKDTSASPTAVYVNGTQCYRMKVNGTDVIHKTAAYSGIQPCIFYTVTVSYEITHTVSSDCNGDSYTYYLKITKVTLTPGFVRLRDGDLPDCSIYRTVNYTSLDYTGDCNSTEYWYGYLPVRILLKVSSGGYLDICAGDAVSDLGASRTLIPYSGTSGSKITFTPNVSFREGYNRYQISIAFSQSIKYELTPDSYDSSASHNLSTTVNDRDVIFDWGSNGALPTPSSSTDGESGTIVVSMTSAPQASKLYYTAQEY